jgi:hypothetical protein
MDEGLPAKRMRCLKCKHEWKSPSGSATCHRCQHKYVEWLNHDEWQAAYADWPHRSELA